MGSSEKETGFQLHYENLFLLNFLNDKKKQKMNAFMSWLLLYAMNADEKIRAAASGICFVISTNVQTRHVW